MRYPYSGAPLIGDAVIPQTNNWVSECYRWYIGIYI